MPKEEYALYQEISKRLFDRAKIDISSHNLFNENMYYARFRSWIFHNGHINAWIEMPFGVIDSIKKMLGLKYRTKRLSIRVMLINDQDIRKYPFMGIEANSAFTIEKFGFHEEGEDEWQQPTQSTRKAENGESDAMMST